MTDARNPNAVRPGLTDHAIAALNSWLGEFLAETGNELQLSMGFYRQNRPIAPADLPAAEKVCVLVHGLGCNEACWTYPERHGDGDYGRMLQRETGHAPLYLRYNSGRRISFNGKELADLLDGLCRARELSELVLIGHSMGGLVVRSACHHGAEAGHSWVEKVRHAIYVGSPHLGAPLEKATNVATHILSLFDTTATRVIRDLLNSRGGGVKDLRYGNLIDEDWLGFDPDELLKNRRVSVPWLRTARHHRIVAHALPAVPAFGDAMVLPKSAAAAAGHARDAAPNPTDVAVVPGLDHWALPRHPDVFEHIARWVRDDA